MVAEKSTLSIASHARFFVGLNRAFPMIKIYCIYREQKVKLEPGDKLYLYTDGVTEAFDVHEKQFSEEWMLAELNRDRDMWDNPNEMLNRMYAAIADFSLGADQSDDITMVYLAR